MGRVDEQDVKEGSGSRVKTDFSTRDGTVARFGGEGLDEERSNGESSEEFTRRDGRERTAQKDAGLQGGLSGELYYLCVRL